MGQIDSFEFRRTKFNSSTFQWWVFIRFTPCKHKKNELVQCQKYRLHIISCAFSFDSSIKSIRACVVNEFVSKDKEKKHTQAHNLLAELCEQNLGGMKWDEGKEKLLENDGSIRSVFCAGMVKIEIGMWFWRGHFSKWFKSQKCAREKKREKKKEKKKS